MPWRESLEGGILRLLADHGPARYQRHVTDQLEATCPFDALDQRPWFTTEPIVLTKQS